jgi:hypothetical protein
MPGRGESWGMSRDGAWRLRIVAGMAEAYHVRLMFSIIAAAATGEIFQDFPTDRKNVM